MDIYRKVADFCAAIMSDRDAIFTASSLTTAFMDAHLGRDWPEAPEDMRTGLFIGIQQIVRPLARQSVPEDDKQIDMDLPEDQLVQERYSVPAGKDADGNQVFKYVPRHRLTEDDVRAVCERDRKLSAHFARRADALESWFYRSRSFVA